MLALEQAPFTLFPKPTPTEEVVGIALDEVALKRPRGAFLWS